MKIELIQEKDNKFPCVMVSNKKEILLVYKESEFHYEGHLLKDSNGIPFCPHRSCHEYRSDWNKDEFKFFDGKVVISNE